MKKTVPLALILLFAAAVLTGCVSGVLPSDYDEITATAFAEVVVEDIDAGDYDGLAAFIDRESEFTIEDLKAAVENDRPDMGEFKDFEKVDLGADNGFARAVVHAGYENGNIKYTIVFDTEYHIKSLRIR